MNLAPPQAQTLSASGRQTFMPNARIVPFDQVITFDLTGKRDNVLSRVLNISIEGHFVAVAISYSLRPEVQISFDPSFYTAADIQSLTLRDLIDGFKASVENAFDKINIDLDDTQKDALARKLFRSGLQLNPGFAAFVISQGGRAFRLENLSDESGLFQSAACPDNEVNFLYRISDNASSRDLQSEPIHNIAGLGIGNGDRPFRHFPQPLVFEPRTSIRVQITEITGIGRLYFVLQGYKVLGTARQPRE